MNKPRMIQTVFDCINILSDGPDSFIDATVCKRLLLLKETTSFGLMAEALQNILHDCVRYSLCSGLIITALEFLLDLIRKLEKQLNEEIGEKRDSGKSYA